jgi:hypothetical protein
VSLIPLVNCIAYSCAQIILFIQSVAALKQANIQHTEQESYSLISAAFRAIHMGIIGVILDPDEKAFNPLFLPSLALPFLEYGHITLF